MLRLSDEQVDMLRHDNVSHDHELITAAYLLEYLKEEIAIARCA
jgi:hypothetical protein